MRPNLSPYHPTDSLQEVEKLQASPEVIKA